MAHIFIKIWVLCIMLCIAGCADFRVDLAPVEGSQPSTLSNAGQHQVREGETLYSIAWLYNKDVRALATLNYLSPPYDLKVGQMIVIQRSKKRFIKESIAMKPVTEKSEKRLAKKPRRTLKQARFEWPSPGQVIAEYSGSHLGGNQGIDIAGHVGDPIRSVGAGKVVYRGEGIRGYGLLVIIKHSDNFLSAYAHNHKILVQEGETVTVGQIISEMGSSGTDRVKLHFEIRKAGKPVDPKTYLKD